MTTSFVGLALLAFACSVYDAPTDLGSGHAGQTNAAGDETGSVGGAGAGKSSQGGAGTSQSGASAGGTSSGSSGAAGRSGSGGTTGNAGTAGSGVIEPSGGMGGAPDVVDDCPDDPNKLAPGSCGCGVPQPPSVAADDCQTLKSLLIHRYDFEGSGTAVKDRVGIAHGVIARGATLSKLDGRGVALLGGGDVGPYVDLPNGLVSSLTDATFEAWITWGGGNDWQRIFDFGDSTATPPENNQLDGKTYLFVTPKSGSGVVQIGYSLGGVAVEQNVPGPGPLAQSLKQVVAVVDDTHDKLQLYVDGAKVSESTWTDSLSKLNDVNVWLGRSQYKNDAELNAVYHEFRIYGAALTTPQVTAMFHAGTDPAFLAY